MPLLLLLVGTLLLGGCSLAGSATNAAPDRAGATQPAAEQQSPARGAWRPIAAPPIAPAGGVAVAWTGRQLVVWGGQAPGGHQPASTGAVYDPTADRWEELPPEPSAGRFGATAVWTGREVLFWGGHGALATPQQQLVAGPEHHRMLAGQGAGDQPVP